MIKFRKPYVHEIESETFTAYQLFQDICEQANVEVGSQSFPNSTYVIQGNAYTNNETLEYILKDLAKLAGGYAKIGRDNKCYIKILTKTPLYSIDGNDYLEDCKINGTYGKINKVSVGLTNITGEVTSKEDSASIETNGLTEVYINDISFLNNEEERSKIINNTFNSLNGIEYTSAEYKYKGFSWVDSGDCINLVDLTDTNKLSYIFNHTFKYDGALSGSVETGMVTKTEQSYSKPQKASEKIRKVEYQVDKINGQISTIVETIETNETQTNNSIEEIRNSVETVQTQTEYAISVSEQILEDGVTKVDTKTGFTFNEDGLTIDKTGAKTKSIYDETGIEVKDKSGSSDETVLFAGYDEETNSTIVKSKNITVDQYFIVGKHSRMEDFIDEDGDDSTGVFWLG